MSMRASLMNQINEASFAVDDVALFLDTHPKNATALARLKMYRSERARLVEEYTARFGSMNETANTTELGSSWKWIEGPWPWENKFAEE